MGWSNFFGGIGKLIEKGSTYWPGRIEKLKNERAKLLKEQEGLRREVWNVEKGKRMDRIHARLDELEQLLSNCAKD
jgi:hypothetical protein